MNTIKKFALILIIILASSSGLLFGCQALYSKMKLNVDVDEITLYLTQNEEEQEPETPLEEGEEAEEEKLSTITFTASIQNLPKNVSNNILTNFSFTGIVKVEQIEKDDETNTITFEVTALKAGSTILTLKTQEGNKQQSILITVVEPLENIEANLNYKPMVLVGQKTNINTIETLKFTPSTTNQKDVVFSLVNVEDSIELTESGFLTVLEKTSDYVAVRATSVDNENIYAEFLVKVIEPILLDNIKLSMNSEPVEKIELSSNVLANSAKTYSVLVEETTESINIDLQATTRTHLDIEKVAATDFTLRSIELGQTTVRVVVSVVGYEQYYVEKNFDAFILEYPTFVSINNQTGSIDNQEIFDQYVSARGAPFNLKVGPVGAFDKRMMLQISEEDAAKIEITYSDGTPLNVGTDVLPNNVTIYIKAKVDEYGEIGNFASLKVISYATLETENIKDITLNMVLKRGANDLVLTSPNNVPASLSIQKFESAIITFEASPAGASLGEVNIYSINSDIVSTVKNSATQFTIQGLKAGSTRLTLVSSNGINKNVEVQVYVPLTDVTLNLPSPSENTAVAVRERVLSAGNNKTLSNITVSVGSGLSLQVNKYPLDANIITTNYASSNVNIASISASGYIVAKALGTTTITVSTSYYFNLGNGESEVRQIERQFTLNVYMPIIGTQLNHYQATLFDANTLGFSEIYKSRLQLNLNINPANATFNQSSVVWAVNSAYATISQTGLVQVSLPSEINSATVTVTATIQEYSRYYVQKATITIQKPVKVAGISVLNVDDRIYFDARNGLGSQAEGLLLQTRTYPTNASNNTLTYRFIENMAVQDQLGLTETEKQKPVVIIEPNGRIIPNRVGSGMLHIIAQDSYTTASNYTQYVQIPVRVADGISELRAIEISSAQDLLNINTLEGLNLHYVLSKTIDLTGVNITPIGMIDGIDYGFSGVLSGDFSPFGYAIENQIIGANFNVAATTVNNTIGLFSSLTGGGVIKDLSLRVNTLSINLSSNSTSTQAYVAPLVGRIQSGIVSGVKIHLLNSLLEIANRTNYIGGIAGHVSTQGQIVNSQVWGQLNIKERPGVVSAPLMHIGGLTGYNLGQLSGNFVANSESLLDNFASYNSNLRILTTGIKNLQATIGGIAGYNSGTISGLTTNASVSGLNNVGGAVGFNLGSLNNILASGFVAGQNNIGGLVGQDQGTITNAVVFIFDQFALTDVVTPQIIGKNNVGGLIGNAINSTVSYSYVRGFYTRAVDNNLYSGDIQITLPQTQIEPVYVGGFIGRAQIVNLNTVYAHLNVNVVDPNNSNAPVYAGGLIGGNTQLLSLQNAYTKGSLNAEGTSTLGGIIGVLDYNGSNIQKVYAMMTMQGDTVNGIVGNVLAMVQIQNSLYLNTIAVSDPYGVVVTQVQLEILETYTSYAFSFVSLGGQPFALDVTQNEGTAYMMYADNVTPMLISIPTDIQILVNDGITNASEIANNHFKIDNKKAVVYYYQNAQGALNTYSLDNETGVYGNPILQKTFTPSNVNVRLINFVSSDNSIVRISENGLIEVLKEGVVTITAYSILDKNVYDEFELAVIKPVTSLVLYEENVLNHTIEEITSQINMKVGDKKRIYPVLSADINGDSYGYNSFTKLYYQATNPTSVSMDGYNWQGDFTTSILITEAHVIRADYVRYGAEGILNSTVMVTPSVNITFSNSQEVLYLNFLQKQLEVRVVQGSTELTTQTNEANINPKDIFVIDVTLKTDTATGSLPYVSVTDIKNIERVTGTDAQGAYITEIAINDFNIVRERISTLDNTVVDRYIIEIKDKFNKQLYSTEQIYLINFASYDKSDISGNKLSGEPEALINQVKLNVIPQNVLRIDSSFFPSNEVFENEEGQFYNPNELPAEFIMAGKIGLLKLNVYPEYANMDYVDLTYTSNRTNTMSFEQVAYVFEQNDEETQEDDVVGYTVIYPQSEAIQNGIRLQLKSVRGTEIPSSGGLYNYAFDGNLYVRVLIGSEVGNDTTFTLTAVAYNNKTSQPTEMLRKSLTLKVEPASQLEISYGSNKTYKYVPIGVDSLITISVSKLEIFDPVTDIKLTDLSSSNISITYTGNSRLNGYILEYDYYVTIAYSETYNFDQTFSIQAVVERVINNNKQQYKSNNFTIIPVIFTIDAIDYVTNVNTQNRTYNVAFGGTYPLSVVLKTTYKTDATNVSIITSAITSLTTQFSQNLKADDNNASTWYTRQINAQGNVDTMLEAKNYINYVINKIGSAVSIQPRRVSSGDVIVAKIMYQYTNGIPVMQNSDLTTTLPGTDSLSRITTEYEFSTNFYLRTEEDNPIPIYDAEGLTSMQENGHYILMNDLSLDEWKPLTNAITTLDGNNYTITINSFMYDDTITSNTKNYGLFESILSSTTLKNMTVRYPSVNINASQYEQVNFGGLVAMNNGGIIYNSYVYSGTGAGDTGVKITLSTTINQVNTTAFIGGLVGQNSGYITNSRSELMLEANKGYISGLVANNSGIISSSYYKNGQIKNTSLTKLNSAVAGLVVFNANNAKIINSFVEGKSNSLEIVGGSLTGRIIGGGLEFSGDLAGFVYENQGIISNSYANIRVTGQSRSSGFVFNNRGTILNSHSMSRVAYNVAAHTPFIGTNEQGVVLNSGTVSNAYYLAGSFANVATQSATSVSKANWQLVDTFKNWSFSKTATVTPGAWKFTTLVNTPSDYMQYPTLVGANHIAISNQVLQGQEVNEETGEIKYTYVDSNVDYVKGTFNNPLTIQNEAQFNAILTEQGGVFSQYVRILKDFNFDTSTYVATSKINFAGTLDGNGMTLSNINVIANSQTTTSAIGLFRSIITDGANIGLVKNLNLKFNEVFANDKTQVGGLAGIIESGYVYDVNINNPLTVVQGKHLVGGLAGKVIGNSHLINISVSSSVNANFRQNVNTNVVYDIYNGANDTSLSYAGAVAGLIDVTSNGKIENIRVTGNSSVLGETVGGVFGLLGTNTVATNVTMEIVKGQFIKTTKIAGGIVGENRGTLSNAIIRHTLAVQSGATGTIDATIISKNFGQTNINQNITFFAGIGQSAGGLIGFNNGGTIENSIAKVDVRNSNIKVVGGLIGRATGGSIINSYAHGSLLAGNAMGGLIGATTRRDMLALQVGGAELGIIKYAYLNQISNSNLTINSAYAYNNWLREDYNAILNSSIVIGGIFGVVQYANFDSIIIPDKNNIVYNNSIYSPSAYNAQANWHYISEYGFQNNSLEIRYVDSYQLSDYSFDTGKLVEYGQEDPKVVDYPDENNTNILAIGKKIFEITTFYPA